MYYIRRTLEILNNFQSFDGAVLLFVFIEFGLLLFGIISLIHKKRMLKKVVLVDAKVIAQYQVNYGKITSIIEYYINNKRYELEKDFLTITHINDFVPMYFYKEFPYTEYFGLYNIKAQYFIIVLNIIVLIQTLGYIF